MSEDWRHGGFGLYVHWPFCTAKCPYCDFNSHVADHVDQTRWERAYLGEIARLACETGPRVLDTIYLGGGTPSLMHPDLVARIIAAARAAWPVANDLEVTLEANPGSVEAGRFRGYRDAGVTRVSLGVQALDDTALRALGRIHSAAEARRATEIAHATFDRVSLDLIYAREGQTLAAWEAELHEALALASGHLSLYQLTIEPGTAFARRQAAGGLRMLPDDDLATDLFLRTQDICGANGLPAYEISNHAFPGAESRHNLIYWRYGDYAGIGPGAHGRLTLDGQRRATQTPLEPEAWLRQVELCGHGEDARSALSPRDQAAEYLMLGLRLRDGIALDRLEALCDHTSFDGRIDDLADIGLIERAPRAIRATARGRLLLDGVISQLLAA